jgi:site-specific recombinase XerD
MLSLYRRHLTKCPHRAKGREYTKCTCPIWCDGEFNSERCRESLKTRDWQRAIRLAEQKERPNTERSDLVPCEQPGCNTRVERGRCEKHTRSVEKATEAYFSEKTDMAHGTLRNYRRTLNNLQLYLSGLKHEDVDEITREMIASFRGSRKISARTWTKELEIVRGFFRYCVEQEWMNRSPAAARALGPKNLQPTDKEPYEPNDIIKILAACDGIGQRPYERLRARAMTLLLRYTALRIGDVATFAKDRIRNGEVYLRTMKNGKVVKLPVHRELQAALSALPEPIGSAGESKYLFWSGNGTKRSMIRDATRTMATVFKASRVAGAHAHRFRHTLATEILVAGGSLEDAADVLGNSPNIIRKHYGKWCKARQARISTLFSSIFGTSVVHEGNEPAKDSNEMDYFGGRHGVRTHDPHVANVVLSQLS